MRIFQMGGLTTLFIMNGSSSFNVCTGHDQVDEFLRFEDAYSLEGALVFAVIPTPTRHPLEYQMVLQSNQR